MAATPIKDLAVVSADHGELSYNGIEFSAFRKHKLEGVEVWDEAERTVTHVRYKLTVGSTIYGADEASCAALMATLRQELSEPGRTLKISGMGLGNITVGGAAPTHADVEWGPKPRVLSMEAVGGLQAIEIVWQCEFSISECSSTAGFPSWLAMNYTAAYRIDPSGLTTRVISGYVQIPQSREPGGSTVITHSADEVWDSITFTIPAGFRRLENSRQVSANANRLDFNIVDQQLGGAAFPNGIIEAEARYRLGNTIPLNFEMWSGTLTGSYKVAPGRPKAVAAQAFYLLMMNKLSELNTAAKAANPKNFVTVERISAENSIYSQDTAFQASFTAAGCLDAILGGGGLWSPVPGSNYQQWAASLSGDVWANRGTAGLRHVTTGDAIIDVCTPTVSATLGGDGTPPANQSGDFKGLLNPEIPEDGGWLAYENRLVSHRGQSVSSHSLLEQYQPYESGQEPSQGVKFESVTAVKPQMQYNGGPTDQIVMVGKAMRLKHRPTVPALVSVGGVPVREIRRNVDGPRVVTCFLGLKVYVVRWAILYQVDGYLSEIPAMKRKPEGACCDE